MAIERSELNPRPVPRLTRAERRELASLLEALRYGASERTLHRRAIYYGGKKGRAAARRLRRRGLEPGYTRTGFRVLKWPYIFLSGIPYGLAPEPR